MEGVILKMLNRFQKAPYIATTPTQFVGATYFELKIINFGDASMAIFKIRFV